MNIYEAASKGEITWFENNNDYEVNEKNNDGYTALMLAASNGHKDIVSKLLAQEGIDVNAKDDHHNTALIFATQKGHTEIVYALLAKGADVNAKDDHRNTALIFAAEKGHTDIVHALLEKGADVNAKNALDQTALMYAAEQGNTDISLLLLADKDIKVNAKDNTGQTALMFAASNGHTEVVKLLLDKGALINIKDNAGQTALMFAAEKGHTEIVRALLENGAKHKPSWEDYFFYNASVYNLLKAHSPEVAKSGAITRFVLGAIAVTAVFIPIAIYLPGIAMYIGAGLLLCAAFSGLAPLVYTNFVSKELQPNTRPKGSNTLPLAVPVIEATVVKREEVETETEATVVNTEKVEPSAPPDRIGRKEGYRQSL